jgi:transmembrane sensor
VRALGTTFSVRRDETRTTVTLVEGKVTISSSASASTEHPATPQGTAAVVLAPGQRVTIADNETPRLDEPELPKVLAWQRREVALDNATLATAIAEMNRYSRRKLECAEEKSDAVVPAPCTTIHLTGLFRAGDSESFARAVAEAYHLKIITTDDVIRLE